VLNEDGVGGEVTVDHRRITTVQVTVSTPQLSHNNSSLTMCSAECYWH